MSKIEGKRILITGPAGQIAFPLAARLAKDNEVFGVARFSDAATRERCEAAGIKTAAVDLVSPDWSKTPESVDFVLHLAAAIGPGEDYDASIEINAGGTGHVMSRYRDAKACLMMSTCGVYAAPRDYSVGVLESDPLGGTPQPYAPTYCVSKISQEAVGKFAALEFGLPTTIARMNAAYGDNGGFPAMVVVSPTKKMFGTMRGAYSEKGLGDYLRSASSGNVRNLEPFPKAGMTFKKVAQWDRKDAAPIVEEPLEDL